MREIERDRDRDRDKWPNAPNISDKQTIILLVHTDQFEGSEIR